MGLLNLLERSRVLAVGSSGLPRPPVAEPAAAQQTKNAMRVLCALGFGSLFVLAIWSGSQEHGIRAFTWSLIAALAVLVTGGALGLLFGLPTAQTGSIGASPEQREDDLGYRESTSLEQVADWLTKILIGLTLTQFTTWEARFATLSSNLTWILIADPSPVPGGMLLTFYGVLGFLIAYLWMRRYFIHELVAANVEARELRRRTVKVIKAGTEDQIEVERRRIDEERRQLERAREQARLQEQLSAAREQGRAPAAVETKTVEDSGAVEILKKGESLFPTGSEGLAALATIEDKVLGEPTDPEDPWRDKFGGKAGANSTALEADVKATSNPNIFRIDLVVRATTAARTRELAGQKAVYYLHPTFGGEPRISTFGADARAPLELYAYGAFTTGVVLEDGTRLELNLATLEGVPDAFRSR